ncbi:MAG: ferredoxin family protein [Chloroflexota bacterium]|nr:ferredoxin family protein [Chloroflexota bacterium]
MLSIVIDEEKCSGCALCVEGCFVPCLALDESKKKAVVVDRDGCLVCRTCEDVCRSKAIKIVFADWPGFPQDRISRVL